MIDFKKIKVLLLDGSCRQILPIMYDIKELGCHVTTFNTSRLDNGYTSLYPDNKILKPEAHMNPLILQESIDKEIMSGKYDVVIPFSDNSTNFLTLNEEKYSKISALACAPRSAYIQAFNKQITFKRCLENNINCPLTRQENEDIESFLRKVRFPIIIKPRNGYGSIGFAKIETVDYLCDLIAKGKVDINKYVIQECVVDFKIRYYVNAFFDKDGTLKSVVSGLTTRWFPIDAGAGSMCQTKKLPDIIDYSIKLLESMNWKGFAQVTWFLDPYDNIPKVIEINGRIPAGIKTNRKAGVSVGRQLIEFALGLPVTDYGSDFKEDIITRCILTDFLWFLKSPDRFRCKPSWFRFWKTYDVIFSLKDPIPFFAYLMQHVKTMRRDIEKRKHTV